MKKFGLAAIVALVITLAGCVPPYRQTFEDAAKEKHWTHKQMLAAFAYYDRIGWSREVQEGKGEYVIVYGKVPTAKVASQIEVVLRDLDQSLDPKDKEMRQYLDTFNMRKDMEHEEEITQAQYARVHAADLYDQFQKKLGDKPEYGPEAEMSGGYNMKKIFLAKDVSEAFPFKSEQIEGAKKDGSLKEIESLELDFSTPYDHKASNPNNPGDDQDFVWKPKKLSIRLTDYKIISEEKPQDNKGNYIEGYRVVDGKQESKPALKIFIPSDGYGAVVLIDTDREGDTGFGVPDILQSVSGLDNVTDVIRDGSLLATLFQEKKTERRVIPPHNLFKIEISRTDQPIDPWEKSTDADGWIVPFKYALGPKNENYNVRIKFKKMHMDPNAVDHDHSDYMEIEYIAKEYTKAGERYEASSGAVIEYFKPKGDFAKKCQAKVLYEDNTKKLDFVFEDGNEVTGIVTPGANKFIEDKPYAKSYNEGTQRFWVESSADNGKFDKRKKVSPPKDRTGEYSDYDMEEAQRPSFGSGVVFGKRPIQRETDQAPPAAKQ